ncbi:MULTISPECIES: hypothetical protein [Sphingomonas]|uniref:hypothetical protein n=1 Tax=Sphingomonas TaxID=13687 RepID=UPI001269A894|nr:MULTISPECIES: hypothetical protein [Sphingomonas]
MTPQVARYRQPQARFVRIKAQGNESIPLAALVGGITLALGGAAAAQARPVGAAYEAQLHLGQTAVARQEDVNPADALEEMKQAAGLTWAQLALLLEVSRTTLHDWTSGAKLRAGSQAKLVGLLDRVRAMTDVPKFKKRSLLLGPTGPATVASQQGPLVVSDNTPPRHRLRLEDSREVLG